MGIVVGEVELFLEMWGCECLASSTSRDHILNCLIRWMRDLRDGSHEGHFGDAHPRVFVPQWMTIMTNAHYSSEILTCPAGQSQDTGVGASGFDLARCVVCPLRGPARRTSALRSLPLRRNEWLGDVLVVSDCVGIVDRTPSLPSPTLYIYIYL